MKLIKLHDVQPYNPPKHFNMVALKLHGEDESGLTKFWQGLSYFLPQGGAQMQYQAGTFGAEFEKTYYLISGQLTVQGEGQEDLLLQPGDSIAILPNEGRQIINNSNTVATVLVTVSTS